jgi:ditrans,polycis-polyprenyl diphosphate synthase
VKVVTIYAFSIENFKRSKYEVDALMNMAKTKLSQLAQHGELLERYGACIRILGLRELLREDVIEAMDEAVAMTAGNKRYDNISPHPRGIADRYGRAILNVCFPYTSRDEMATAMRDTVIEYMHPLTPTTKGPFSESRISRNIQSMRRLSTVMEANSQSLVLQDEVSRSPSPYFGYEDGSDVDADISVGSSTTLDVESDSSKRTAVPPSFSDPENITETTLSDHMFTAGNPPLDLLIRTSGVERLSDFMLWQSHQHTSIVFLDCLWPQFDLWHFLPVLLEWQWLRRRQRKLQDLDKAGIRPKEQ